MEMGNCIEESKVWINGIIDRTKIGEGQVQQSRKVSESNTTKCGSILESSMVSFR